MECRVKHCYLRYLGQYLLYSVYTFQVGRVVQRSQVHALNDLCLHFGGDEHRLVELLAAVHYAVTDSLDLLEVFDTTDLLVHQGLEDEFDTYGMLGHRLLDFHFLAVRQFNQQERVRQTDLLDAALGHNGLALHVEELVLDTATSAVQN